MRENSKFVVYGSVTRSAINRALHSYQINIVATRGVATAPRDSLHQVDCEAHGQTFRGCTTDSQIITANENGLGHEYLTATHAAKILLPLRVGKY